MLISSVKSLQASAFAASCLQPSFLTARQDGVTGSLHPYKFDSPACVPTAWEVESTLQLSDTTLVVPPSGIASASVFVFQATPNTARAEICFNTIFDSTLNILLYNYLVNDTVLGKKSQGIVLCLLKLSVNRSR